MADDIASLGINVDSAAVEKADVALDKLATSAKKAERATDDLKDTWQQYSGTVSRGVDMLSVAARALPLLVVGAAIKNIVTEGLRFGDQLVKSANVVGIAAGEFSEYAAVAKSVGADLPAVSSAFETLGRKISQSASGNKEATRTFQQLGLDAQFLRNLKPGEQLEQIADALSRLENPTDRIRLGYEALGGSVEKLLPALEGGAAGLRRLREEQVKFGNALTTEQAARLEEGSKAVTKLGQSWRRFATTLTLVVEPPLTAVLDKLEKTSNMSAHIDAAAAKMIAAAGLAGGRGAGRPGGGRGLGGALDPAVIAETIRELDKGTAAADRMRERTEKAMRAASLSFDLAAIKRNLSLAAADYSNYETLLEADRRAGLINERQYYDEKRKLIEDFAARQIAALEAESKRLREQKVSGPDELETQTKIADNEANMERIRDRATAQIMVLGKQQSAAMAEVARSYDDARIAAEGYLATLNERWSREVSGMGLGRRQRERDSGRSDLDADFERQRQQLERDKRRGDLTQEQYDSQLAIIREFHQRSLKDYDEYWDALSQKQSSFAIGASEAIRNYADEAADVARQSESVFTRAFEGMEDALVNFVTKGKLDFKSLAESIIADLLRIQIKAQLSQVFSMLGGFFSGAGKLSGTSGVGALSGSTVGFAAAGGNISGPTIVGERGPEMIIPRTPMTVIPNHALGGVTINQFLTPAPGTSVAQFEGVMQRFKAETKSEVYSDLHRDRWRRVTG